MVAKYIVEMSVEERMKLSRMLHAGKGSAAKLRKARILLKADEGDDGPGWTDERIADALEVGTTQIRNTRKRFVEEGLEAAINRRKQCSPSRLRMFDGEAEARLVTLACSKAPAGRSRWTLQLLADRIVALNVVESTSIHTVARVLKKTRSGHT